MNKKQATAPAECLKMNIELADNGIIIRNPELEDDVELAMNHGDPSESRFDDDIYKAIGKRIYDWLIEEVVRDHASDFVITKFDIDIKAVAKGREF